MVYNTSQRESQELEAGAPAEAMEGAVYRLAPQGLLSLLFYTTQEHLWRVAPDTENWTLRHQSLVKKTPPRLPTGQSYGGVSSMESPCHDDKPTNQLIHHLKINCVSSTRCNYKHLIT